LTFRVEGASHTHIRSSSEASTSGL